MVAESLEKLRVANTVVGRAGGVPRSSDSWAGEWRRERLGMGWGCDWSVPRRLRVIRPLAEGSSCETSGASTMPAGVEGSALTWPLLPGRSSDVGIAPAAVLTDWLRVTRADSSAVDDTVESGLRSRLVRLRARVVRGGSSGSTDCSEFAPSRFRVDLVDLAAGSERFKTGLRGSAAGDGRGVPGLVRCGGRFKPPFGKPLGGVARAAMMSDTIRAFGGGTSL